MAEAASNELVSRQSDLGPIRHVETAETRGRDPQTAGVTSPDFWEPCGIENSPSEAVDGRGWGGTGGPTLAQVHRKRSEGTHNFAIRFATTLPGKP
jgi:hypothetical protein